MSKTIQIRGLTKRFQGRTVVDDLELEVPEGAIFALLGDNGAGKSTTIRMLTGLLKPDAGRATVLGHDCWRDAARLRQMIGYVTEKPRFYDWMTVKEVGWFSSGFHGADYLPRYLKHIERFELDPKAKLSSLSKGQYAKVALSVALALKPEVFILDEPTSGLDLFVRREFLESMVKVAGKGRTVLISSHQLPEVERVASHAAFIARGKLLMAGPMEELRERLVRISLSFEHDPPDCRGLGQVVRKQTSGRQWQAVLVDPDRRALERLKVSNGFQNIQEMPLALEEMYTALLQQKEEEA